MTQEQLKQDRQEIAEQIERVQSAQSTFWDELSRLENMAGVELDSSEDFSSLTLDDLEHPQTDEHLAACPSCMMAHDKQLPNG